MAKNIIYPDEPRRPTSTALPAPYGRERTGAEISNPFSTGGGGHNFENHVQAAFVVLMLSGGVIPCVRAWPITKIKLQGRHEGFNTDDFIAFVEERNGPGKAKLLAQIKHSLSITERDPVFATVIEAAWLDFKNPEVFDPKSDAIALVSGPLNAHDIENARIVLDWARTSASAQEFLEKVQLAKFSSASKKEKLQAFRTQLKNANQGSDVDDETLWRFLKCFHILGYDLDVASGVTLSLLNSHIAQFNPDNIAAIWATVAKEVELFNQSAGTITFDTLSDDVRLPFSTRYQPATIPTELLQPQRPPPETLPDHFSGEYADALMFASLLGGWNDNVEGDKKAIDQLIRSDD